VLRCCCHRRCLRLLEPPAGCSRRNDVGHDRVVHADPERDVDRGAHVDGFVDGFLERFVVERFVEPRGDDRAERFVDQRFDRRRIVGRRAAIQRVRRRPHLHDVGGLRERAALHGPRGLRRRVDLPPEPDVHTRHQGVLLL
jgi:hypothetical protein